MEASGDQNEYFSEVCVLTGHEDWIRGIDVRPVIRERHTQSTIGKCNQKSISNFLSRWYSMLSFTLAAMRRGVLFSVECQYFLKFI